MNLAAVMDEIGAALGGIEGLRVFPYWTDRLAPPAAMVGWPDPLTFDATYGRGSDKVEFPLHVAVGKFDARSSRDRMAKFADGGGEHSIKAAIESHTPAAYDTARVTRVEFDVLTVADVDYLAATFYVEIIGRGA